MKGKIKESEALLFKERLKNFYDLPRDYEISQIIINQNKGTEIQPGGIYSRTHKGSTYPNVEKKDWNELAAILEDLLQAATTWTRVDDDWHKVDAYRLYKGQDNELKIVMPIPEPRVSAEGHKIYVDMPIQIDNFIVGRMKINNIDFSDWGYIYFGGYPDRWRDLYWAYRLKIVKE